MYVINNIQKINIPFVSQDYKKKDGTNYSPNADRFMAGGILKDFKKISKGPGFTMKFHPMNEPFYESYNTALDILYT